MLEETEKKKYSYAVEVSKLRTLYTQFFKSEIVQQFVLNPYF